ncbi:Alcohol dehydrogenase 2 [Fonsecaea pedrosoi]|nr:Alcohol dehydrogenase 2 [Fonsecaea pedrosoi]
MADVEIPQNCIAGCVEDAGQSFRLILDHVPVPRPGPDEILLKLDASGICYSDIHYMLEDLPTPRLADYGLRSPGHEGIGSVVSLGSNVKDWKIGDRGGVKPIWDACMNCELCWDGRETYCPKAIHTGCMKTGVDRTLGTYQQYILSPAKYTTRIPPELKSAEAAPLMCAGSTMYRSIKESGLKPQQWACILGAGGGVGHLGIQIAKAMGLRVIGIDGGPEKEKMCMKLGCHAFVDFSKVQNIPEEVVRLTDGKGAHGVFVTATSPKAYTMGIEMLRIGGVLMCVGLPPFGTAVAGGDPALFIGKNIRVTGTQVGSMKDTHDVLDLAVRKQNLIRSVITTFPISQLPEAVQRLRTGNVGGRCVVEFET